MTNEKMVYSDSLDRMVISGFTMKLKRGGYTHYTWSDEDCVYWNDDIDGRYREEVPDNAIIDR